MISYLGKIIDIVIDRPIGYVHEGITYPVNYGYIPGTNAADGEEIEVYLLGIHDPCESSRCRVLGVIHRENDIEDKLVAAPPDVILYQNEILEQTNFIEQYFKSTVTALYEKSCGAVVHTVIHGEPGYLLLRSWKTGDVGFPKGHVEMWETEKEAAKREIQEETSLNPVIWDGFRKEISYIMPNGRHKTVVFFLAMYTDQDPCHCEGFEFSDYLCLPYAEAMAWLTHDTSREVLEYAHEWMISQKRKGMDNGADRRAL